MITHLTQQEVADRLKLSVRTLERWRITSGVDLPYLKCGAAVRYRLADVEAFEVSRLRGGAAQLAPYAGKFQR